MIDRIADGRSDLPLDEVVFANEVGLVLRTWLDEMLPVPVAEALICEMEMIR